MNCLMASRAQSCTKSTCCYSDSSKVLHLEARVVYAIVVTLLATATKAMKQQCVSALQIVNVSTRNLAKAADQELEHYKESIYANKRGAGRRNLRRRT